jgi:hypothetical protein
MKSAESLKKFITENFKLFTDKNVIIGSIDLSRYESKNLCVIIPEETSITDLELGGEIETQTSFTLSFLFRGEKHTELIERMETFANDFQVKVAGNYSFNKNVTDVSVGKIKYFYDCGTVEKQATGLDIEMTITETKEI